MFKIANFMLSLHTDFNDSPLFCTEEKKME